MSISTLQELLGHVPVNQKERTARDRGSQAGLKWLCYVDKEVSIPFQQRDNKFYRIQMSRKLFKYAFMSLTYLLRDIFLHMSRRTIEYE